MAAIPYMPLYIADYLADAAHLSTEQHGAYLLLIMNYWQRGGPVPASDEALANVTRMTLERWAGIKQTISAFFSEVDGKWMHKRIDAELSKFRTKSDQAKAAGKASAERKANGRSTDAQRTLNGTPTDVERTFNHTDTDTDTDTEKNKIKTIPPTPQTGGGDGPQKVPSPYERTLTDVATQIHERHPDYFAKISVEATTKKLKTICDKLPAAERIDRALEINNNHIAMCSSYEWTKEGGAFAKKLENWLAPSMGRFDGKPRLETKPHGLNPAFKIPDWGPPQRGI